MYIFKGNVTKSLDVWVIHDEVGSPIAILTLMPTSSFLHTHLLTVWEWLLVYEGETHVL
jgi:hypothetical protein